MKKNPRLEERRKLIDPKIKESIDIKCEQMKKKNFYEKLETQLAESTKKSGYSVYIPKSTQMKPKIIFTKKSLPFILEALGLETDDKGIVRDRRTNHIIEDVYGFPVKAIELIGIAKNKFITSDLQLEFLAEELHQDKLKKLL